MSFEHFATKGIYKNLVTQRMQNDPDYYNAVTRYVPAGSSLGPVVAVMVALVIGFFAGLALA